MDSNDQQVTDLYPRLLDAWNLKNARGMADLFIENGEPIGYGGSQSMGQTEFFSHLAPIFDHRETCTVLSKVKSVRFYPKISLLSAPLQG